MALINCKECDTEFSTLADKCPKCGAPTSFSTGVEKLPIVHDGSEIIPVQDEKQPPHYQQVNVHHHHNNNEPPPPQYQQININQHTNAPEQVRYISTLLFLGIIFFPLIFYWFLFRKGHTKFARVVGGIWLAISLISTILFLGSGRSSPELTQISRIDDTPELSIDAMQYYLDYQNNELNADQKYKEKVLLVGGIVSDISKDFTDKPYLSLMTDNIFMSIRARLQPSEIGAASKLSKGQSVIIRCIGGGMSIKSPILRDCILINKGQQEEVENIASPIGIETVEQDIELKPEYREEQQDIEVFENQIEPLKTEVDSIENDIPDPIINEISLDQELNESLEETDR